MDYTLSTQISQIVFRVIIALQLPSPHPTQTSALCLLDCVVPAQGNLAMDNRGNGHPNSCAVHNLCNCMRQFYSQKLRDHVSW